MKLLSIFQRPEEAIAKPLVMSLAYREGEDAAKKGVEHWENPYAEPDGNRFSFSAWYAGWCYSMKVRMATP